MCPVWEHSTYLAHLHIIAQTNIRIDKIIPRHIAQDIMCLSIDAHPHERRLRYRRAVFSFCMCDGAHNMHSRSNGCNICVPTLLGTNNYNNTEVDDIRLRHRQMIAQAAKQSQSKLICILTYLRTYSILYLWDTKQGAQINCLQMRKIERKIGIFIAVRERRRHPNGRHYGKGFSIRWERDRLWWRARTTVNRATN